MAQADKQRWVLHADMDAFYASIEQRDHPELRGKPVIVGATSARGVVSAASYEARQFGVRSAMPGFRARELCPHGVFLAGDMPKYVAVSSQIRAIFEEFTPEVQPLALDEAFLDVTGSFGLFGSPAELGRALKARVREATDLVVSVGLGPNKLVAKIACTLSKPDGLMVVPPEQVEALLRPLPVRRLWGVGPVLGETLGRYGIRTLGDLADYDAAWLERLLGPRAAELQAMARGHDTRAVEADLAPKSYGEENTFERDISDRELVSAALTAHAEAVAARMRRDRTLGRTITLRCKLARRTGERVGRTGGDVEPTYPLLSRSRTLPRATDDGAVIRRVALELWDALGLPEPVRLLGVAVSKLEPRGGEQLFLFGSPEGAASVRPPGRGDPPGTAPVTDVRSSRLGSALDAIRDRFGSDAIRRAVAAPHKITHSTRVKAGVGEGKPEAKREPNARSVEPEPTDLEFSGYDADELEPSVDMPEPEPNDDGGR